jgi:ABC-type transport system involved in cytochrome bd biosynthesis fused ATPase/permease subunit
MVNVFGVFVALISDCALLLVMFFGLSFVDPISAVTSATIFGSLALFLFKIMHHKMQSLGEKQGKLQIRSAERINEAVNAYRELLVRNRRGFYAQQIGDLRHELADGRATLGFMSNLSKYVLEITLVLGSLLLASYQFYTSSAFRAIATITIFVAASTRIIPAILRLQQGLLGMKSAFAEAKPTVSLIEELIHIQPEVSQVQSLTRDHYGFCPEVRATNISFSYDTNHRVLKGVDLYVGSGEFVAIVGGSGAGKTTLVDVLLGALDYDAGQIEISGTSPKLAFSSWPGAVSYVSQDCMVINGTIKENLGLGYLASEIEDAYCWESLRFARLDDFVRSLPLQLNSYVGDRGTSLSGGQRQRLGIARALI